MRESRNIKVLLVDDEPLILRSLRAVLPWDQLGMEIAGDARNGEEALRMAREIVPDLVLSDIRMPSMDGVSLMKRLRSEVPDAIVILVSGYGEFEYAREGLRQGAFDYILKPIDHEELGETVRRAAARAEHIRKRKEEEKMLHHSVHSLSMLARERMYAEMIEGNAKPYAQWKWLEQCELQKRYYMMLVSLDESERLLEQWNAAEMRLWFFAVRNILEDIGQGEGALAVFPFHRGEWVLLFQSRPGETGFRQPLGLKLISAIRQYARLSCSVGISRDFMGVSQLSDCYRSAKRALMRRFYEGGQQVFADDGENGRNLAEHLEFPKDMERRLLDAVRLLNRSKLFEEIDRWKEELEQAPHSREAVERVLLELVVLLRRHFEHWHQDLRFREDRLFAVLHRAHSLDAMAEALKDGMGAWIDQVQQHGTRKEDAQAIVAKAKNYIANCYHRDISIDEAADYAGVSVSHFCHLFKQETGMTFLEYLTKWRMDKARYMLEHTDVKVYRIAPLVGYQDAKYFTQVFKKMIGMKPSQYREQARRRKTIDNIPNQIMMESN